MTTEKQIAANRGNAERSTGPKTEEGKLRSRLNATTHGLASTLPDVELACSTEFNDRRARWGSEHKPVGENAEWALDRAVAATFRIERCEQSIDDHITDFQNRAKLTWEQDRALDAAILFGRLARDPILASRQLQTTLAGVGLLMEAWLLLLGTLKPGRDWSESERSKALDLLGVDRDLRDGRMPVDAPEGTDSIPFRQVLTLDELDRLENLRDRALIPLDEIEQRHAIKGSVALLSKQAKLLLRYEREAWKHYHQSMKEVKNPAPVVDAPVPVEAPPPKPPAEPDPPAQPSVQEQPPAEAAKAAPVRNEAITSLTEMSGPDLIDILDDLGGRPGLPGSGIPFGAERSQFLDFAVGRA